MTYKPFVIAAAATLALAMAWPAQAMTLTNRDGSDLTLMISENGQSDGQEMTIAASETLDDLCANGCTITLEDGQQHTFNGDEEVYIEGGRFVIAE